MMKDHILVTKEIKLNFSEKEVSINELNFYDIIEKYSDKYIIDLEKYAFTILNDHLIITLDLKEK